ncbi:MAG: outer membrane beta-barrel protein [Flavobacteriaceae bacterium]|nr:outer membrane beta-barrel protein [Flavobacteriaceae bacterium]
MRFFVLFVFFNISNALFAQDSAPSFREDQIYLSVGYPFFSESSETLIQNKLSYALSFGFVRDMPINKSRTLALGMGLGWDMATLFTNTRFFNTSNSITASIIEEDYQQNYISVQSLAIPFEFRWRNATETNHAFWRIHAGVSLHVPLKLSSFYKDANGVSSRISLPSNSTVFRLNVHFGFNTWNISLTHDLQPWTQTEGLVDNINMRFSRIGFIFYVF